MEARRDIEDTGINIGLQAKTARTEFDVLDNLHHGEEHTQRNGNAKADHELTALIFTDRFVGPSHRGA